MAILDVDLWIEGCATKGSGDRGATMGTDQSITISILLIMYIWIEVDAWNSTDEEEIECNDDVADDQNDEHCDIQPLSIFVVAAVIRITIPEYITYNKPYYEETVHDDEKCSSKV